MSHALIVLNATLLPQIAEGRFRIIYNSLFGCLSHQVLPESPTSLAVFLSGFVGNFQRRTANPCRYTQPFCEHFSTKTCCSSDIGQRINNAASGSNCFCSLCQSWNASKNSFAATGKAGNVCKKTGRV